MPEEIDIPHAEMLIANSQADAAIDETIKMRRGFLDQTIYDWTSSIIGTTAGRGAGRPEVEADTGSPGDASG